MQLRVICDLASGIAKGGHGMVGLAGQYLTGVLEELVLIRDLKMNRVTTTITVSPGTYGPFALEADYLRTYDIFYQIPAMGGGGAPSSQTLFLNPITMEQFDAEFKSPTQTSYPYEWASDTSTDAQTWSGTTTGSGSMTSAGGLYIYPASNGVLTLNHRYMKKQPDYATPQLSQLEPWFPYSDYLITATAAKMCRQTGDDRWAALWEQAENMLRPFLIQQGDEQETVQAVRLDPRHFRISRNLRPVKIYPYAIGIIFTSGSMFSAALSLSHFVT